MKTYSIVLHVTYFTEAGSSIGATDLLLSSAVVTVTTLDAVREGVVPCQAVITLTSPHIVLTPNSTQTTIQSVGQKVN